MNRGKQTELGRLFHHAYERCVNQDNMPFNLNGSMVKDNSHVRDQIIKYCKLSSRKEKLARRLAIYKSHPEETPAFATAAECLKVLVDECQSEEEDVPGDKTLLDRQVPTWRSKNLNDFFKRLDKVHDNEATRKWGEKDRVDSVVVTALHPDIERKLPAWSKAV
ncbi:uncharacterized protein EV154DRAFT_554148 [Mucor mucedo]|uniref:uncharacterized protein n=1 Tax=Mucor mucedo TaxID=29922 RepID=UPI00221FEAFB|nr:uncharacterized protein EV154DRAFT_554148 [Mucor mucedo]KAI7888057.1 hypothetical protein EV154DRAFT_554148 [Mucor mucedo]